MAKSLLWWEYEQLVEHLQSRPDIWSSPRQGMWLRSRSYDDDTALFGLATIGASPRGTFQRFNLSTVPMAWTTEQIDEYLESLFTKWTDYGTRRRYREFLRDEGGFDESKADLFATALTAIDQGLLPDRNSPLPASRELWPDVAAPHLSARIDERVVRTFPILGGGWLRIRLSGGMLKVRASLSSDGRYGGGFSGEFEGFIRPSNNNVELAAAFLFGSDVSIEPLTPEQEEYIQQQLRGVADNEFNPRIVPAQLLERPEPGIPTTSTSDGERGQDPPEPKSSPVV